MSLVFAGDFADLARSLPDLAVLIDDSGALRWGNAAAERFFGVRLAEGVGRNMLEFMHPDDVEMALVSVEAMQRKDVGTLLELRLRAVDGWRLVEVRGARFGADLLLVVRDISDRRRWEVAHDEAASFRALMQNGTSITVVLNPQGEIRSSSAAMTRLLGHDQETLEGQRFAGIVTREDQHVLTDALGSARDRGRTVTVDLHLVRRDRSTVPFAVTFTNLLDDPSVGGIVATGHDISDRVLAEEQQRETNSLLATTLEATTDGILVIERDGEFATCNERFAQMCGISNDAVARRDKSGALAALLDQLVDPDSFKMSLTELSARPEATSNDVVHFGDGRVFESRSQPRRVDHVPVGRVFSFRDITEHEQLKRELARQALHDALTGLPNKTLFRDRTDHAITRLRRSQRHLAVLFVDLDDFKHVNDTYGHWAGDALLVQLAERLSATLRAGDTIARLGGDEFAVLLDDLPDDATAITIADRILHAVRHPIVITKALTITASIGVAYGDEAADTDELLRNADLAMYAAKADGKNAGRIFTPEMYTAAVEQLNALTPLNHPRPEDP